MAGWILRALTIASGLIVGMSTPVAAQQAVGDWHGRLDVGAVRLRLGVTIARNADGGLAGTIVSPDQGPQKIPIASVVFAGPNLSFQVPSIGGSFAAKWDAGRKAWDGTWTQGRAFALILLPGAIEAALRPQEPKPPFPYREEQAEIDSVAGVRLAGTLTVPPGGGPFPAVVLITGSGPQNRDEELLGHKPFLVLADYLTRRGIAVLRYDDRGTAKSTGTFAAGTTRDFAQDAQAAVRWLRQQPRIDPAHVGAIGHSEGGLIAPMVAERDPKLAFVVLLAGPGVRGADVVAAQADAIGRGAGLSADVVTKNVALLRAISDAVIRAPDIEHARAAVAPLLATSGVPEPARAAQLNMVTSDWYRQFAAYDPAPALRALRIPLLALNGANDKQVLADQNLPAIRAAAKGNPDATIMELPGLNHLFQTSDSGNPQDYGTIEETFSPAALTLIGDWVLKHR